MSASATSSGDLTWTACRPLLRAPSTFSAPSSKNTIREAGTPIDASGVLSDGTKVDGPAALRNALLSRRDDFAATVVEKLMTYALGRGVEYYDQPAIRKIVRDASSSGDRWSTLILGIVNSVPFQMREQTMKATLK